ncbi:MAG TPA: extracellular solute-binding protein [Chloroflexota bacterium]|jgi:iron(III) transport system substrate-binding protein|nr:extracellular solute-binding protein [Chloroflexota bacterium]
MAKAFTKTGAANVSLVDDSTGNLLARISAEKNNPHWDIVWFDGDGTMRSLADQGFLATKWTPANSANYSSLGAALVPKDHAYFPTGVTAAGVIIYNTKKLTPAQAPTEWTDLLTSRFKDGVAENDPAFSGPAYPYIAGQLVRQGGGFATALGKGEPFFTKLKANGLKIFQTNDPTLHSVQTGARLAGIVQDSAYYAAAATGAPIGVVYPRSGVTTLPGVIAINARSKHLQAAEAFVNYVLSQTGQNTMVHDPNDSDSYFTPIIKGIMPLSNVKSAGQKFQNLDPIWAGAQATTIKTWFHNNIVQ